MSNFNAPSREPHRIISLDPAVTEIIFLIGGGACLVARSQLCDWPPDALAVPVVYRTDEGLLRDLRPDLFFAHCDGAVRVPGTASTIHLDTTTVEGVCDSILTIGQAIGRDAAALAAVVALRERLFTAAECVNPFDDGPTVAVLQSVDPLVVGGFWIPQLVERAGGRHPLNPTTPKERAGAAAGPQMAERTAGPARTISHEELAASNPKWIVLSLRGLSFEQGLLAAEALAMQPWWRELSAFKSNQIVVVNGDQSFNRPGPRLADSFEFLVGLLHNRPAMIDPAFRWSTVAPGGPVLRTWSERV